MPLTNDAFASLCNKMVWTKVLRGAALSLTHDDLMCTPMSYASLRTMGLSYARSYARICQIPKTTVLRTMLSDQVFFIAYSSIYVLLLMLIVLFIFQVLANA